ncbi:MAG: hypothetical protein U0T79_07185 [Ferruginibacter sp.]
MNYTTNSFNGLEYNSSIPSIFDSDSNFQSFGYSSITSNRISDNNYRQIKTLQSFSLLQKNWDSYDAEPPSSEALLKAINFALWLSQRSVEIFFTTPLANGDIIVELKYGNANVEFVFSKINSDKVLAWCDGELMQEADLNETTQYSYLNWLMYSDANSGDFR